MRGAIHSHLGWTADDQRALIRVIVFSVIPGIGITVLLELTPLTTLTFSATRST